MMAFLPGLLMQCCHHHQSPLNLISPIRPREVKSTLKHCSSTPGEDGISYLHLRKMSSYYHFVTNLYSKILLNTHHAPEAWCQGLFRLLPKRGDPSQPCNFRPIILTSTIGIVFHKILTSRLEEYLRLN